MRIGVPTETKDQEFRVGLSPSSVRALTDREHQVIVQSGAGLGSGFADDEYQAAGATIGTDSSAWAQELIVKVKEPLPLEYGFLRSDQILFTYLHLAANLELTQVLLRSKICAIAYETVEMADRRLPLLMPMSVIAGRLAVQIGARFLERQQGGRGVLLGGVPGVASGHVVILGGGVVGTEAAKMAIGLGARVTIVDVNVDRLTELEALFGSRVSLLYSTTAQIEAVVPQADLLIGAVLVPGKKAPILVKKPVVGAMRSGSVVIDVAVDQGGCIETIRTTSHTAPTYIESGVVHYGVPNMPGAVPWTATQALNNSTLPYVLKLADGGLGAIETGSKLAAELLMGVNVRDGALIHPAVRSMFPQLDS